MQYAESYQAAAANLPEDRHLAASLAVDFITDAQMADIHQRIARRLADEADGGEMIDTLAQSYPLLKAITDGIAAGDMSAALLDRLADLYRLVCRTSQLVADEIAAEVSA